MSASQLPKRVNDSVHRFVSSLTSRIIAESGQPNDQYHLGKMILQSFKDCPDFVIQERISSHIDGGTGEEETNRSVLERSVRCAVALKNIGLTRGDVMVLTAPNHIHLTIPFYAALYLGVIVAMVDRTLAAEGLRAIFDIDKPKLVICQSEKVPDIQSALFHLNLDTQIVTFDKREDVCSFSELLDTYGKGANPDVFRADNFDPEDTIALLLSTSGSTGLPKTIAITHKNFAVAAPYSWARCTNFPTPTKMIFIFSPLQWVSALLSVVLSPILKYTRLQTSLTLTPQHAYDLINKYKPTFSLASPNLMTKLVRQIGRDKCDFTCYEHIMLGGSHVPQHLIEELKKIMPEAEVINIYGITEISAIGFLCDSPVPGSCGRAIGCNQYRLIDVESQNDVTEPNVTGELWIKGAGVFKEYYNNPEETRNSFAEDNWFKTGDLFYRDENWNYFFVDRLKLLMKCQTYKVSPVQIEAVISQHPGVADVAVTSIVDEESGELPVACVVRKPGTCVTAQEIKDIVKEKLSDA